MSSLILTILKSIVFNFALNSKQSTCETAAKKCVVDETWPKFKKQHLRGEILTSKIITKKNFEITNIFTEVPEKNHQILSFFK